MSVVKKTFSISSEINTELQKIPTRKRSDFVSKALKQAFKEQKKARLLEKIGSISGTKKFDGVQAVYDVRNENYAK